MTDPTEEEKIEAARAKAVNDALSHGVGWLKLTHVGGLRIEISSPDPDLVMVRERMVACDTCGMGEDVESHLCEASKRECGHHCNHTWSHDECCWCGAPFYEDGTLGEAG